MSQVRLAGGSDESERKTVLVLDLRLNSGNL